jgi:hypothetical protein
VKQLCCVVAAAAACLCVLSAQQPASPKPALAKDPGPFLGGYANDGSQTKAKQKARPKGDPIRHLPDGRPDFDGDGAWYPGFHGNIAEPTWKGVKSADEHVDVPFLPASLELYNMRVESLSKYDPEARCLPVGVPRYMYDPYPFKMLQLPDRVLFIFEGNNYGWREVRTETGASHPANLKPTWLGDSIGHYEGDTLVVDAVGFNGLAWLDQAGHEQTSKAHLTERYTRIDSVTLKYSVTIDDPGAYSKPWVTSNTVYWRPGFTLAEYICDENEKDSKHMVGK